jgi:hypothetical protein
MVNWALINGGRLALTSQGSMENELGAHKRLQTLVRQGRVADDFQYHGGRCGHGIGDD